MNETLENLLAALFVGVIIVNPFPEYKGGRFKVPYFTPEKLEPDFRGNGNILNIPIGEIKKGTYKRIKDKLEKGLTSEIDVIQIDSIGGSINEARRIAELLSNTGLPVRVAPEGQCLSSCLVIYTNFKEREAYRTSLFGFHRTNSIEPEYNEKYCRELTKNLGPNSQGTDWLCTLVLLTPNSNMHKLTGELAFEHTELVTKLIDK
jgi:hypothetical protein